MRPLFDDAALAVAAAGGLAAAIDLRTRRVPNVLTFGIAAVGFGLAVAGLGRLSVPQAIGGLALGLALMLPGHLFGGTGAGDVKLFAALGTLIGPAGIAAAFLYTAIAGGAIGVFVAIQRKRLGSTVENASRLVTEGAAAVRDIEDPKTPNRFAYAPAIAIGATLAALGM